MLSRHQDPMGVLEEGEIYIRSSERLLGVDGLETNVIVGDVLVTRHPCKVPTDVQKVGLPTILFTDVPLTRSIRSKPSTMANYLNTSTSLSSLSKANERWQACSAAASCSTGLFEACSS